MTCPVRPELFDLDGAGCRRVYDQIGAQEVCCEGCGGADFAVGAVLYLGYLFLDEDTDAYLVALTCRGRDCPRPHSGIVLHRRQLLGAPND